MDNASADNKPSDQEGQLPPLQRQNDLSSRQHEPDAIAGHKVDPIVAPLARTPLQESERIVSSQQKVQPALVDQSQGSPTRLTELQASTMSQQLQLAQQQRHEEDMGHSLPAINQQQYMVAPEFQGGNQYYQQMGSPSYMNNNVFQSNDTLVLQQRLAELQNELGGLDQEFSNLQSEQEALETENSKIKQHNKDLFSQITLNQEATSLMLSASAMDTINPSQDQSLQSPSGAMIQKSANTHQMEGSNSQIGEIHSLYQDLFLTDIKKEVETAKQELKSSKKEQNEAHRELQQLKRDNTQLTATLKRYRRMLQELSAWKEGQEDDADKSAGGQLSKRKQSNVGESLADGKSHGLKRKDSNSSMISGFTNMFSNVIDSNRIERLLQAFTLIQSQRTRVEIIKKALTEIKNLVAISVCTVFVMETELMKTLEMIKPDVDGIRCERVTLDGNAVTAVGIENISRPMFKTPEEVKFGMKTQSQLAYPVRLKDEDILLIVQIDAKKNKKTDKSLGFQPADEQIMRIMSYFLSMQFEKTATRREVNMREKEVTDTLQLASEICSQRNFTGLFHKMREFMPKYFGFEGVGVLIFDRKKSLLFTDPNFGSSLEDFSKDAGKFDEDIDGDSGTDAEVEKRKKADREEEAKKNDPDNQTAEQKMERLSALHNAKIITFPVGQGISGQVFFTEKLFKCNDAEKESNFSGDIDNQSSMQGVVKNFMIGPVFGKDKAGKPRKKPVGIIQFINKKDGAKITDEDEIRFAEINSLLGMCIDSTKKISKTIDVTLKVNSYMKNIGSIMQRENNNNMSAPTDEILNDLQTHIGAIQKNYGTLVEAREKAKI